MLRYTEGGCSLPIGCETTIVEEIARSMRSTTPSRSNGLSPIISRPSTPYDKHIATISLTGTITSLAGTSSVIATSTRLIHSIEEAEIMGEDIAKELIRKGGRAILEELGKHIKEVGGEEGKEIPFESNNHLDLTYSTEMIKVAGVGSPLASAPIPIKSPRPRSLTYPGDVCKRPAGW